MMLPRRSGRMWVMAAAAAAAAAAEALRAPHDLAMGREVQALALEST
jgi:hypothetical protein